MVPVRVRDGKVIDVGRTVADLGQLTLERSGDDRSRSGRVVRAGGPLRLDDSVRDDAKIPHQCSPGMRDQKAGYGHAGLAHLGEGHVIAQHTFGRDVEQAAVEDVQPHGFGSLRPGRSSGLSGGARAAAQSNEPDDPDDRYQDDRRSFACDVRSIRHVAPPGRRGVLQQRAHRLDLGVQLERIVPHFPPPP